MKIREKVVGAKGFEPSTSWSRTRRASQAALRPDDVQRFQSGLAARILDYHSHAASATISSIDCVVGEHQSVQKFPERKHHRVNVNSAALHFA